MRVDDPMARIDRLEKQDRVRESVDKAEKFVLMLKPGKNYFTPDQYRAIIFYIWPIDDDKARDIALAKDEFSPPLSVGARRIVIVRVPWIREDRLVSLTDLSKLTGINRRTLDRKVSKLNVPVQLRGGKKMFNIESLREHLADKSE